ncbi:hypothetical protein [Nocardia sp. NBC_00416]|uniref:hypothetical protein n=1 Tax=Nocardia sp. NBC_00416 TaxID=2975991 RepID=UPI002E1DCF15
MAEQRKDTDQRTDAEPGPRAACRRGHRGTGFSPGLFIVGVLALVVSAWALIGPGRWDFATMIPIGWIIVAVAIVVGLALVVSPRRRR